MKKRKAKYRADGGRIGVLLVGIIVVSIGILTGVRCVALNEKNEACVKQQHQLESQIAEEEQRTEDLNEYKAYVQTKQYIEKIAKEQLNLVYPDEILFKCE